MAGRRRPGRGRRPGRRRRGRGQRDHPIDTRWWPAGPDAPFLRGLAGAVWAVGLASLTLVPAGGPVAHIVSLCLLCGSRGAADAVLNVVLFVPFGLLVGTCRRTATVLALGMLLSLGVESAQFFLPGRHSNLGDVAWNGLGAWLGACATASLRRGVAGHGDRLARVIALALPTVWLLATAVAVRPVRVEEPLAVYDGTSLRLEGEVRQEAPEDWSLEATTQWPATTHRTRPIVVVYDALGRPVRLLAVRRQALVFWERTWAGRLRLDRENAVMPRAFAGLEPGASVDVSATRSAERLCLVAGSRDRCGFGVSPARSWTIMRSRGLASERFRTAVDVAWMAVLSLLVGLVGGSARETLACIAFLSAVVFALPFVTPLVGAGRAELVGLLLGVATGVGLRPVVRLVLDPPGRRGCTSGVAVRATGSRRVRRHAGR